MTPAEEIRATIKALGTGGQRKLARLLPLNAHNKPVNPRTIRRWLAGKSNPHPMMLESVRAIRDQVEGQAK
jgi:hypothetical protein